MSLFLVNQNLALRDCERVGNKNLRKGLLAKKAVDGDSRLIESQHHIYFSGDVGISVKYGQVEFVVINERDIIAVDDGE